MTRSSDSVFATGASESFAQLWSFEHRKLLVACKTKLSAGGSRLTAIGGNPPILVAAGWGRGVAAYDLNGHVIWKKSLPKIQKVCDLSWRNVRMVGVGLDASSFRVLQAETGDEIAAFNGVREVFASPYDDRVLRVSKKNIAFSRLMDRSAWRHRLESFAVLTAALGPDSVAYSEAAGHVICRDFKGVEMWRYIPRSGWHVLHLAWNSETNAWAAGNWQYEKGGRYRLIELSRDGKHRLIKEFPKRASAYEFLPSGTKLVSADGGLHSSSTAEEMWRFVPHEARSAARD